MAIIQHSAAPAFWRRLVSWGAFPGVLAIGVALHVLLKPLLPLYWSTQLPVAIGALLVLGLEYLQPYRRAWLPRGYDYTQDLLFMVLVQILLPKAVAFGFVLLLVEPLGHLFPGLSAYWPHHWPIALQMIWLMLLADFGRYWLHRWFHTVPWLWRFHAVHHSPQRLYWTNVGRFHPFDKGVQLFFDTLPFMLLGVRAEVLSLYFVCYAINGFFQHCNIDLRLGWLNYLVSGPELHRWHHSRLIAESNNNYGNNLILWDLCFGTRFLPAGREVAELGLLNRHYPDSFAAQLKMPFLPQSDKQQQPELSWRELLVNSLLHWRMQLIGWQGLRPLKQAARQPRQTQQQVLLQILKANQQTEFGKRFGFDVIKSIEEYQQLVPVQDYDSLQPLILRQAESGQPALTAEQPLMYNQTSGTTGQPKYIPILAQTLKNLKQSQNLYSYIAYSARPQAFAGKLLGIVSPACEGHLPTGQPYGSASGHIYQNMPAMARSKYVLPAEVFEIADYELKYYLILRLALAEPTITYMGSANPSTFKKLLELLDSQAPALLADLRQGSCQGLESLPEAIQQAVKARLRPEPQRAAELEVLFASALATGQPVSIGQVWPYLQLISTWTGGSCQIALAGLQARIPEQVLVMELGYLASEFRGTITIDAQRGLGVPTLTTTFFEFVETQAWEREQPVFLTLDQLEMGKDYYLLMTTEAGLYRYHMNDIVRVTGHFENTPTLSFVQKGKGVTSITGEKLYESQLIAAVSQAEQEMGLRSAYYLALADESRSLYRLYIEFSSAPPAETQAFAARVEQHLFAHNLEYQAKRGSGRLHPLSVTVLKQGTYEAFKAHCLAKGQREGQFKIVALQYHKDFDFELAAFAA